MNTVQKVSRTELARNTRQVLSAVQRGRTTLIENYGEPEAALLDIVDYRIMRAVMRAYAEGQRSTQTPAYLRRKFTHMTILTHAMAAGATERWSLRITWPAVSA